MKYLAKIREEVTVERDVWVEFEVDPRGKELNITENLNPRYKQILYSVPIHKPILLEVLEIEEITKI